METRYESYETIALSGEMFIVETYIGTAVEKILYWVSGETIASSRCDFMHEDWKNNRTENINKMLRNKHVTAILQNR